MRRSYRGAVGQGRELSDAVRVLQRMRGAEGGCFWYLCPLLSAICLHDRVCSYERIPNVNHADQNRSGGQTSVLCSLSSGEVCRRMGIDEFSSE